MKCSETLLLLLSHFSHVQLCVTPETSAHQAPPSLGFSRQEHWSGLPLPSPMHESESEVIQSCPTLHYPMDCSPPGSPVPGSLQARTLEWVAIAFSNVWKWKVKVKSLSRVRLCDPTTLSGIKITFVKNTNFNIAEVRNKILLQRLLNLIFELNPGLCWWLRW